MFRDENFIVVVVVFYNINVSHWLSVTPLDDGPHTWFSFLMLLLVDMFVCCLFVIFEKECFVDVFEDTNISHLSLSHC